MWIRGVALLDIRVARESIDFRHPTIRTAGARQDGGGSRTCLKRTRCSKVTSAMCSHRIDARNTASR
ncbi:unnamed protein product, partial [Brenthis ino]